MASPIVFPIRSKSSSSVDDNWNLVVKVKYGDTLRRFYAYVRQGFIDHNLAKFKAKIVGLFKFEHDAQLVLTYIDGDGDEVTLDNDDELHDAAIHQHLNPLRINVKLKPRGVAKLETKLGETNYYSSVLPSAVLQSLQANSAVNEALKSIPQHLQDAVFKISHDLSSKAASSSTAFQEILEYFSKSGLSSAMQSPQVSSGESFGTTPVSANCSNVNGADNQEAVNENMQPVEPSALSPEGVSKKFENVTKNQWLDDKLPVAFHQNLPNSSSSGPSFGDASTSNLKDIFLEKINGSARNNYPTLPPTFPPRRRGYPRYPDSSMRTFHAGVQCDGCGMLPIVGPRFKSNVYVFSLQG